MRRIVQRSESIESQKADIAVCIVDPDTRTPLPVGQPGLLLVRGPNVMQGYLGKPEKTAEVLQNGWYVCRLRRFIGNVTAMQLVDPYLTNA